ncbi:MAG: hypothetical protein V7K32_00305 [Nostoc sp.]|uniref:hypothetical protein n=1 Tax=Nostoc sp. TaxID=1180 RepID=UPI002FF6D408
MTTNLSSLSLTQLFGEGAYQDANILIIKKSSLLRLTASPDNTAESLLVAMLITALTNFSGIVTNETFQMIIDENNQPILFDNSEAFELIEIISWQPFQFTRNNQFFIKHQIIIKMYASD